MTFTPAAGRRRSVSRTEFAPAELLEERIVPASLGLPQDLVGFNNGAWQVGISNGSNAFITQTWASWAPSVRWDALRQGDFNNDGRTDVVGLLDNGGWWVGLSTGNQFVTTRWGGWSDLPWQNVTAVDLNGDGFDDIFGQWGNSYYAALTIFDPVQNRLRFDTPSRWGGTGGVTYQATLLADVTGDDAADLVLLTNSGRWLVGASFGTTFGPGQFWTGVSSNVWPDANWEGLTTADIDGNGLDDVVGFVNGVWWIGLSTGNAFAVEPPITWSPVEWRDVRIGDFDGNGVGDLAGRVADSGAWYVTRLFLNSGPLTNYWGQWNPSINWQDVRVGDFNGDGRDDIAGRDRGSWWVAQSTRTNQDPDPPTFAFRNFNWTPSTAAFNAWNKTGWRAVATVQLNNTVPIAGPVAQAAATDSTPDAVFWTQSNEDDEFAAALLASAV